MEDLFNVNPVMPEVGSPKPQKNPDLFTVNLDKEPGECAQFLVKLLPNPISPTENSMVSKYTAWLKDVVTKQQREIEVIQGDGITETFFNLRNSGNPVLVQNSKIFSRKLRYSVLMTVLASQNHPEMVGKIFIFRFSQKLADKILIEQNGSEYVAGRNVFNVLTSRNLLLKYKMVNGFPSTDDSQFIEATDATALKIPMQTTNGVQMVPLTQATVQQPGVADAFRAWLNTAPDITPYKASEPGTQHSDEEKKFIWDCIQHASDPNIQKTASQTAYAAPVFGQAPAAKPVVDSFGLNSGPVNAQPAPKPAAQTMPQFTNGMSAVPQATTPGGFAASNVPDLSDVLGGAVSPTAQHVQPQAPSPVPGGGLQLGDVLGEII